MTLAWPVFLFVATRLIPAAFRMAVAVVVWLFTFVEAHHAAILAALSYLGTLAFRADTWLLMGAKAGLAYFGAGAFAGLVQLLKGEVSWVGDRITAKPLVAIEETLSRELAMLSVAWHRLASGAPRDPPPPTPPVATF